MGSVPVGNLVRMGESGRVIEPSRAEPSRAEPSRAEPSRGYSCVRTPGGSPAACVGRG